MVRQHVSVDNTLLGLRPLLAGRHMYELYFGAPDRPGTIAVACVTDALAASVLLIGAQDVLIS